MAGALVLLDGDDLDLPFAPQHRDTDIVGVALEPHIHACVTDSKVGQANPVERFRQATA